MIGLFILAFVIGIIVSAPMGPVGMLCMQRTLNMGKKAGLITGLGASLADVAYAFTTMLCALGLSFINDYIQFHQGYFQIIGSIILIIFGAYVFSQNPAKSITKVSHKQIAFGRLFFSSFFLTISNVGTLFIFLALFSRFRIINSDASFLLNLLMIIMVGIGAICWWLIITTIVNRIRHRFNPRGLKIFNRIVGTLIIAVGIIGIISGILHISHPVMA